MLHKPGIRNQDSPEFEANRARLNFRPTGGILKCHRRIQGYLPTYLPDNDLFTEKLGGTISQWNPALGSKPDDDNGAGNLLDSKIEKTKTIPIPVPQPSKLPKDQSEGDLPFQGGRGEGG